MCHHPLSILAPQRGGVARFRLAVLLVIINNLYIRGSRGSFGPFEANPPLVVDADAVLALAVTFERFETVAGQSGKVLKSGCRFKSVDLQP